MIGKVLSVPLEPSFPSAWPRRLALARYRNPRASRTSWPPLARRASPERIQRCWKTATACAGDCGFGSCRVLR